MGLTKVSGGIIQQPIDVGIITATSINASGVITASSFDGNVTGDVTGNVTGNLTGNVTGNVTGNADTASNLTGSPNITVTDITANGNVSIAGTLTYEDVTNIDSVGLITARSGIDSKDYLLSAIDTSISGTAVDIFVYDTRKDSDGGAWRKRTQHTSWYNETLNTVTRGSRREFPAVAVIVTTATNVTIYDGDDPDLPMWMDFQSGSYYFIGPGNRVKNSAHMLNGILCVTKTGSISWMSYISFVDDTARQYSDNDGEKRDYLLPISYRNTSNANSIVNSIQEYTIANDATNDVAMTVLPNAPIDDATGLPVPTIAVATEGGISIIKDDGTIFDMVPNDANERPATEIGFTESNKIVFKHEYNWVYYYEIPNSDLSGSYWNALDGYIGRFTSVDRDWDTGFKGIPVHAPSNTDITTFVEDRALGHGNGLNIIDINKGGLLGYGMQAGIATDFNTGYQHGDIKGAFLSDTTVESLTANTNLASSATQVDTSRLASETYDDGDTSWQMVDNAGTDNGYLTIRFSGLTVGQSYIISMTWDNNAALDTGYDHRIDHNSGGSTNFTHWDKTNGSSETLTGVFTATSENNEELVFYANAITLNVSNFNIRAVDDEDRSVNNKGLQVVGTITKSAVATDAELVAYSGFSASNYLQQPYNSDLDFGTGDFSIMFWYKTPSGSVPIECFLHRGDGGTGTWGSGKIIQIEFNSTNLAAFLAESAFSSFDTVAITGTQAATGQWMHYTLIRRGTFVGAYLNGELKDSTLSSRNLSNTSAKTWIGERPNASRPATTSSLALFRMSASAPSDEQIKKIYNDEKHLYIDNAKATLYGSSDAVTALGYDEDTELLHVGTSSGRSDFQGLRRINNTTTAVTTAISASDELIAEQ